MMILDIIMFVVVVIRLVAANRITGLCTNRILKTIKKKIEHL